MSSAWSGGDCNESGGFGDTVVLVAFSVGDGGHASEDDARGKKLDLRLYSRRGEGVMRLAARFAGALVY